jgi:hypothetical protein
MQHRMPVQPKGFATRSVWDQKIRREIHGGILFASAPSVDSQVAQEELTAFGVHLHEAPVGLVEDVRLPGHGVLHELDLRPARLQRAREDNSVVEVDVHVVVALH